MNPVAESAALSPIRATMRAMFGTESLPGLAPGLLVTDPVGWLPATALTDGSQVPQLLDAARIRWHAQPHAAAALAWKAYTYWLALPPVLGWATARRVPLLRPRDVLVHFEDHRPLITLGLRRSVEVAVLPSDPLAMSGLPEVRVVADEAALLGALRASLLDEHLAPLLAQIQQHVHLGSRTLLGSLASGVAYGVLRAADSLPGSTLSHLGPLLDTLGVADLVDLVPGPSGELMVQRKTCCLAFTLPQPKVCTGCCIRPA
ncbi:MAG TPA: IucA/IucC family C-terminal-domain containing protein [Pilimelia sp.]|nr:IucA/IucC family C-terminal-domain containing protein [Pilimelia sp.]